MQFQRMRRTQMGRGSSKAGGGAGGGGSIGTHGIPDRPDVLTAGEVNFNTMMTIKNSSINDGTVALTGATVSVMPQNGATGGGVSMNNLPDYLDNNNMSRVVVQENRNSPTSTAGLQKLLAAGWQIQAECVDSDQTSGNYYYLVKPNTKTTSTTKKATSTSKTAATKATPTSAKKAASSLIKDATNTKGKLSAKGKTTEFINPKTGEKMRVNIAGATKQNLVTNSKTKATSKASQKSYMVTITNLATGVKDTMNIQSLPALRSYIYGLTGIS